VFHPEPFESSIVPEEKEKPQGIPTHRPIPGVYRDKEMRCCLLIYDDGILARIIHFTGTEVAVDEPSSHAFHISHEYLDYPLPRMIDKLLRPRSGVAVSGEATEILTKLESNL
jgi:hypothetical protein